MLFKSLARSTVSKQHLRFTRTMSKRATLNCDMGEGYGRWSLGPDEELMPMIDMANVACGFHAGDALTMLKTIRLAKKYNVRIGAHPGLDDIKGFGRRILPVTPDEIFSQTLYQVGSLKAICEAEGMKLNHVKPHGALYFMMKNSDDICRAVVSAVATFGIPLFGLHGTNHESIAKELGVEFIPELFLDLEYDAEGNLMTFAASKKVSAEELKSKLTSVLKSGYTKDCHDQDLPIEFAKKPFTICLHSDQPNAIENVRAARECLNSLVV